MICSSNLHGVPLLVLANKQDIPECMGVREVRPVFNKSAELIGRRDCMVMPVSALTGYVSVLVATNVYIFYINLSFFRLLKEKNELNYFIGLLKTYEL